MKEDDVIKKFKVLIIKAVKDGLKFFEASDLSTIHLGSYLFWQEMKMYDDGFPYFYKSFMPKEPIDYTNAFVGFSPIKKADEIESFQTLLKFVKNEKLIRERQFLGDQADVANELSAINKIHVFRLATSIIDRYIHINKTFEFEESRLMPILDLLLNSIFEENLYIDICIPILGIKFNFRECEFFPNILIREMDPYFQLARCQLSTSNKNIPDSIVSRASHVLVLKNWHFNSRHCLSIFFITNNIDSYPISVIDKLFALLRIITNVDTGYAQLIMNPLNWAGYYKADLPSLEGTHIRAYPMNFEKTVLLEKNSIPEITEKQVIELGDLYSKLDNISEKSIDVALRRINLCFNRENEEDSVLDATIGLEALLSDDSNQEITHKLSLRIAALSKFFNTAKSPQQIFSEIKKIYSFRSAIIHGSSKASKRREIILEDKTPIPTVILSIDYLRFVIKTLIENPKYFDPELIDKEILLATSN